MKRGGRALKREIIGNNVWEIARAWMNVSTDKDRMDLGTVMERDMSVLPDHVCSLQMGFRYATVKGL